MMGRKSLTTAPGMTTINGGTFINTKNTSFTVDVDAISDETVRRALKKERPQALAAQTLVHRPGSAPTSSRAWRTSLTSMPNPMTAAFLAGG
jgi:hypothetical protein